MFGWSKNRKDGKWKRENMRDFRWKGCLVGVILEEKKWWGPPIFSHGPPFFSLLKLDRKWGRGSGLIKMSFLPLVLSQSKFNVNTLFFLFLFFDMLLLFFPFMGSLSNVEPRFFFLILFF